MTQIANVQREPVEIAPRRYMTEREKLQRWEACNRCCTVCGEPVPASGPGVIWDHRIAIALGGTNDLANMEPHHAEVCAPAKTARDRKAIAKAHRLIRQADPETRRQSPHRLRGRGFAKDPLR